VHAFNPGGRPSTRGRGQPQPASLASPSSDLDDREPETLLNGLRAWLDARPPGSFFAYLHFLPPHTPYDAPGDLKELLSRTDPPYFWRGRLPFREIEDAGGAPSHERPSAQLVRLYDSNILWADAAVQRVLDLLEDADLLPSTLFILTADHGETFGEHGYRWHTQCPFDETIRVPLLVRFPGGQGPVGRVGALTQTIDVLPTLFDLLNIRLPPSSVQGRSLVPLLSGEATAVNEYVFSQTEGDPPCAVVRDLDYSLLLYEGGRLRALYDTRHDSWQTHNIIAEEPAQAARLIHAFRDYAAAQRLPPLRFLEERAETPGPPSEPEPPEMSEDIRRELEALGYL
jgi:arylsulfatase A-like enzyme